MNTRREIAKSSSLFANWIAALIKVRDTLSLELFFVSEDQKCSQACKEQHDCAGLGRGSSRAAGHEEFLSVASNGGQNIPAKRRKPVLHGRQGLLIPIEIGLVIRKEG